MIKVFACWSGGKDSCFACYKSILDGFEVSYLLNMVTTDAKSSMTHGIDSELLRTQSEAIGIPIVQKGTTWNTYEQEFKKAIGELKQYGVEGGVFGDIDLQEHRDWIERVCSKLEIKPLLPLWRQERRQILDDFISAGFKAVVVSVKADLLGGKWLGREIDKSFVEELAKVPGVDLCGEAGEYHTFVTDGPLFKSYHIEILDRNEVLKDEYWFLDIIKYEIRPKG